MSEKYPRVIGSEIRITKGIPTPKLDTLVVKNKEKPVYKRNIKGLHCVPDEWMCYDETYILGKKISDGHGSIEDVETFATNRLSEYEQIKANDFSIDRGSLDIVYDEILSNLFSAAIAYKEIDGLPGLKEFAQIQFFRYQIAATKPTLPEIHESYLEKSLNWLNMASQIDHAIDTQNGKIA
jgi:hypothetical protein